jgi:D-sedoheptulose 7-phosphate isomerase
VPTPDPLAAAAAALAAFRADPANLARIATVGDLMAAAINAGHKVLACGNGGSLCDAMHFCEELTGRFRADRRPLPAIACIDPGHITCTANDYGFEHVFARWVDALGQPGDILVALSTSGNSPNIINAVKSAKHRGLTTVALLGKDGGRLSNACTHQWIAPGETSDRIQEIHMLVLHALVERIEAAMGLSAEC